MSLLFLTVHKAASRFMAAEVLPSLAADLGWSYLNPFKEGFRRGSDPKAVKLDDFSDVRDTVLGPIRLPGQIERPDAFDGWSEVLLLRDPRDVLVSLYFSMAYSHGAPGGDLAAAFAATRREATELDIDGFVLRKAPKFEARYRDYARRFRGRPNLTVLRYEDMVADWPTFVGDLARSLQPSPSDGWRDRMMQHAASFRPREEDPKAHVRQVAAGDHVRKLRPATIQVLNRSFAESLDWLGLPQDAAA